MAIWYLLRADIIIFVHSRNLIKRDLNIYLGVRLGQIWFRANETLELGECR